MRSADRPAKLFDDRFERPAQCPVGIVVAQLAEIGNVANVVTAAHTSMLSVRRLLLWSFMAIKKNIRSKSAKDLRNRLEAP